MTLLTAAAANDTLTRGLYQLVAAVIELVAVIRAVRLPTWAWTYRKWSKIAAVIAAVWFTATAGAVTIPLGAIAVIVHTRTLARAASRTTQPPDLPFAEGTPENHEADR